MRTRPRREITTRRLADPFVNVHDALENPMLIPVGEKVSVWLNGQQVLDRITMENYWQRGQPIFRTGSIELQNHGNQLFFKNVYVRELPM